MNKKALRQRACLRALVPIVGVTDTVSLPTDFESIL